MLLTIDLFETKSSLTGPTKKDRHWLLPCGSAVFGVTSVVKGRITMMPPQLTIIDWHFPEVYAHLMSNSMWKSMADTIGHPTGKISISPFADLICEPVYIKMQETVILNALPLFGIVCAKTELVNKEK